MSLTRRVTEWINAQPDRCATLAELRAALLEHRRLENALSCAARNGWLMYDAELRTWRSTGAEMRTQGWKRGVSREVDGSDLKYELQHADDLFRAQIGDARYEDVERIRPGVAWRRLLPEPANAIGCSAALLVGERLR